MVKRLRVSTSRTGHRRTVQVIVYDSVQEMQRAATKYVEAPPGMFDNALGVSQPREHMLITEDGSVTSTSAAGTVRFVKGHMGAGIVAHEMVHMGLAIYRRDSRRAPLGNMKNEEQLCHLVSDLTSRAVNAFWRAGLYEDA